MTEQAQVTRDYTMVWAWGTLLHSERWYVAQQVEQAREDGAPQDAVYRRGNGTWATTDDVVNEDTRERLGLGKANPTLGEIEAGPSSHLTLDEWVRMRTALEAAKLRTRVRVTNSKGTIDGVARAITDERGGFLFGEDRLSDAHLWLTSTFEHFLPLAEIEEIEIVEDEG